ncbi:hypothetical protein ElyMa_005716800 [Elysia marginata]|uniref:Uncharacterized protein n=1 Tax=Elysia marginata TaxID=1093978 RepID=A0AAV4FHZ2_9GAST|nr:hypothetical protein ElyMa_005716800 [Elysia marginata]
MSLYSSLFSAFRFVSPKLVDPDHSFTSSLQLLLGLPCPLIPLIFPYRDSCSKGPEAPAPNCSTPDLKYEENNDGEEDGVDDNVCDDDDVDDDDDDGDVDDDNDDDDVDDDDDDDDNDDDDNDDDDDEEK